MSCDFDLELSHSFQVQVGSHMTCRSRSWMLNLYRFYQRLFEYQKGLCQYILDIPIFSRKAMGDVLYKLCLNSIESWGINLKCSESLKMMIIALFPFGRAYYQS